jgi:DNA-directed RNA polymerase subunit RPC12/RpoP
MSYICQDCNSNNIGWDAWVDQDGELLAGPFDNCQCMDCGSKDIYKDE